MPRKTTERLIQFNKDHILETAERLFSEYGIRQTTVDDICKAADCSKSTIYVYFKSKDDIYYHIIYSYMRYMDELFERCVKDYANFEDCYVRICETLAEIYDQHPLYFESMMGNISIDEKERRENEILQKIYEIGETINGRMTALFERGLRENYLREDLLILPTVFTLWASLSNVVLIANQKERYLTERMGMNKQEFMRYSASLLLSSIKKGE